MAMVSVMRSMEPKAYEMPEECGICIYLEEEQTKALGIDKAPEVGTEVMIKAKAIVMKVETELEDGEKGNCMKLEITHMELGGSKPSKEASTMLYGSDD